MHFIKNLSINYTHVYYLPESLSVNVKAKEVTSLFRPFFIWITLQPSGWQKLTHSCGNKKSWKYLIQNKIIWEMTAIRKIFKNTKNIIKYLVMIIPYDLKKDNVWVIVDDTMNTEHHEKIHQTYQSPQNKCNQLGEMIYHSIFVKPCW